MSEIFAPAGTATQVEGPVGRPGGPEREFTVEARSQWRLVVRRFLRHRLAVVSLLVLLFVIAAAFLGPRFWRYTPEEITDEFRTGPSLQHPMGTDNIGHDTLAQVLRGAQKSVQIMLLIAVFTTTIGVVIGSVAGYFRGWVDAILARFIDLVLTVPLIVIAIVLSKRADGDWFSLAVVISLVAWTSLARIVRAEVLSLREKEFVEAARAMGASDARIIFRHILPNIAGTVIVSATLTMAAAILIETTLSFLGFGVDAPDTSLGKLVDEGKTAAQTAPWQFYAPGLVIVIIALCVNFVGDGLRDAFDPKQTRVRA